MVQYRAEYKGQVGPWRHTQREAVGDLYGLTQEDRAEDGLVPSESPGGISCCWGVSDPRKVDGVNEGLWKGRYLGWVDPEGNVLDLCNPPAHKTCLWLDDIRRPDRWDRASDQDKYETEYFLVQTYHDITTALATNRYTEVDLDYDLSDTDPNHNGLDVMKWILLEAETGRLRRLKIYFHTFSSRSADEMLPYRKAAELSWDARDAATGHRDDEEATEG